MHDIISHYIIHICIYVYVYTLFVCLIVCSTFHRMIVLVVFDGRCLVMVRVLVLDMLWLRGCYRS